MSQFSRRNFLRGGAVVAGGSVLTFHRMFGSLVTAQDGGDDPQTILNLAATAETFAIVHYTNALQNSQALGLSPREQSWLRSFVDAEFQHKLFLEANGAQALATEFFVPENLFTDRELFVQTTNTAENWFIAAYLAATRRFAELGEPLLAATASQVSGVESEHQALIRLMGGLQPSFQTLKEPLFWNTSEVAPLFQPFLEGGPGFVGPAAYPGDEAVRQAIQDEGVIAVTPFIQLNGEGTLETQMGMMGMMGTQEAMMEGNCTVSAQNVNVRSAPGTNNEIVGSLQGGTEVAVTARSVDANGFTWYQTEQGWVRADVVQVGGDCSMLSQSGG